MPQGSMEQLNRTINMLNQFMMQKGLIGERMKGYGQLESQRHKNMMDRLMNSYINELSLQPSIQQINALMFKDIQEGKDVSGYQDQLSTAIEEINMLTYPMFERKYPTQEGFKAGIKNLSDVTARTIISKYADAIRARERIEEVEKPAVRVGEFEAVTGRIEAETERLGLTKESSEKQRDRWLKMIGDTINFLETEGVTGESLTTDIMMLFSSAKMRDPLSPENRGKAFSYLSKIQANLIQGKQLTENEIQFLINVRNTQKIKTEGLPSPETGLTPVEEEKIGKGAESVVNQRLLQMITQMYMEEGNLDRKTAEDRARRLIGTLR